MNGDDKPARNMAEAISQEARAHRENAAKNGVQITQAAAEARVRRAVETGDQKRANNNR